MGTHPIFESDFDCLTDSFKMAQDGLDVAQTNYTELVNIFGLFADPTAAQASGFVLNGEKYTFLRIEGDQLLGKSKTEGKNPVCVQKTSQALVIAIGTPTSQAGQLNMAVGKLADYLQQQGY